VSGVQVRREVMIALTLTVGVEVAALLGSLSAIMPHGSAPVRS
jgi:hypothetical protein